LTSLLSKEQVSIKMPKDPRFVAERKI